jgi:hypothetical protein
MDAQKSCKQNPERPAIDCRHKKMHKTLKSGLRPFCNFAFQEARNLNTDFSGNTNSICKKKSSKITIGFWSCPDIFGTYDFL